MNQTVICPSCNHTFEVCDVFEKYERIIADIVDGKTVPPLTAGYDVIDRENNTYQVKYTSKPHRERGHVDEWRWHFGNGYKLRADFLALFAGSQQGGDLIFLLDKRAASFRTRKKGIDYWITSSLGLGAWIWNYKVTPETFIQRRDELMRNSQLAFEIESQYA